MFEKIAITVQKDPDVKHSDSLLDIGALLESMIYYGSVVVGAGPTVLKQLLQVLGPRHLEQLIEQGILDLQYLESMPAVLTSSHKPGSETYDFSLISSPSLTLDKELRKICVEYLDRKGEGHALAARLEDLIVTNRHPELVTENARAAALDQDFIRRALPILLRSEATLAGIADTATFEIEREDSGMLKVSTNIDFRMPNSIRRAFKESEFSTASLLVSLLGIEGDISFACDQGAQLAATPTRTKLVAERFKALAERTESARDSIDQFQEFVFKGHRPIREAFNEGLLTIDEILPAVYRATRFKKWLADQSPDAGLLQSYVDDSLADSKVDKLPVKVARWMIFSGLGWYTGGLPGAVASGLALSAFDGLLLDRLLKGWKPSQFVQSSLRPLARSGR